VEKPKIEAVTPPIQVPPAKAPKTQQDPPPLPGSQPTPESPKKPEEAKKPAEKEKTEEVE
jgi:hypothetical protein